MTRSPAASTVQTPNYLHHESADVACILTACWLHNEYSIDPHGMTAGVLAVLPVDVAHEGLNAIAAELELASVVEACTLHSEFTHLTGLESHGPSLSEDVAEHAETVRNDARVQAEQLVQRANAARWVSA